MSFVPDIRLFSCHYTSQQSCARDGRELGYLDFPDNIQMTRVPCTGRLDVVTLLRSFEDGADGVYVVGCPKDSCHNIQGSQRAAKRVGAVKEALSELGADPQRVEMYHLVRGLHPEFLEVAREMNSRIEQLGPSPFKED